MRVAVFSDLHLHTWPSYSKIVDGFNSRLLDQKKVLYQFIDYVRDNEIRNVYFTGDFWHRSKVPAECLMVAHEALTYLKNVAHCYFLTGNHDYASRTGSVHALSFLNNYGDVIDGAFYEEIDDLPVCGLPYTEDKQQLQDFLDRCPTESIVLLHQGISNVSVNAKGFTLNEILTPDMITDKFKLVLAGHYHSHTKVKDNLYIPGSPLQLNWGDKNEARGWMDIDLSTGVIKHVESKAPKFVEGVLSSISYNSGDFIRVQSTGEATIEDVRQNLSDAGSVEVVYSKPEVEYERIERFDTFTGLFEEYIKVNKLSDELILVGRELVK